MHSGTRARKGRPPLANVGSQVEAEEEIFGRAFDRGVVGRFWVFVRPYRRMLWLGIAAVLVFTSTQVLVPLTMRFAIDEALVAGGQAELLGYVAAAFFAIITVNYLANFFQEMVVGRMSGHLLFDLRRAMYAHLQWVSLSFMDKTEVCLLYTSPSPRDGLLSRMPSSA